MRNRILFISVLIVMFNNTLLNAYNTSSKPFIEKVKNYETNLFVTINDSKKVEKKAKYALTARVLHTESYIDDPYGDVSPLDFALGWNKMEDAKNLSRIEITQSNRWYHWKSRKGFLKKEDIESMSSNFHIIPANSEIYKELKTVKKDDIIEIKGYLVDVYWNNVNSWKTSTSYLDTGDGACEIVYVTDIKIKSKIYRF